MTSQPWVFQAWVDKLKSSEIALNSKIPQLVGTFVPISNSQVFW